MLCMHPDLVRSARQRPGLYKSTSLQSLDHGKLSDRFLPLLPDSHHALTRLEDVFLQRCVNNTNIFWSTSGDKGEIPFIHVLFS